MAPRHSTLGRWLLALLLLAALAWGVGQLRSERGPKPELGVGDLRGGGGSAAVASEERLSGEGTTISPPSAAPGHDPGGPPAAEAADEVAKGER